MRVINDDYKAKDHFKTVPLTKHEFLSKLFEYINSNRIYDECDLDEYEKEDLADTIQDLRDNFNERYLTDVSFDVFDVISTITKQETVNGFWFTNDEKYGYTYKDGTEKSTTSFFSTNTCSRGLYTFDNGVTMWFFDISDSEHYTNNIALFYDGYRFRFYLPIKGNFVNVLKNIAIDKYEGEDEIPTLAVKEKLREKFTDEELQYYATDKYLEKYGYSRDDFFEHILDNETGKQAPDYFIDAIKEEIAEVFEIPVIKTLTAADLDETPGTSESTVFTENKESAETQRIAELEQTVADMKERHEFELREEKEQAYNEGHSVGRNEGRELEREILLTLAATNMFMAKNSRNYIVETLITLFNLTAAEADEVYNKVESKNNFAVSTIKRMIDSGDTVDDILLTLEQTFEYTHAYAQGLYKSIVEE